jgi:hypothetical protein
MYSIEADCLLFRQNPLVFILLFLNCERNRALILYISKEQHALVHIYLTNPARH